MPNLTGQSIGRYHILEQLGEGGMATVYKAYDTRLERNVAFKVLRTDLFGSAIIEQILKRFEREAKSLAKLKHPNIVNILDFGEHEGSPYLVMEYLPGGTLKQKLGQKIPWQEAIHILIPVARGLSYAHQHGVIHRDVKPANILIDQNNEPILTDFGIAKLLEGTEGHTLTGSGVGIGTPEYMAPEQGVGAREIDARADIYSLGIVFYEMVTGRKPYIADTPMAVVLKQVTDPLPRPSDFVPDLPEGVEHILFKALAKQPDDRYADMDTMIAAMESVLSEVQKVEVPATPKRLKKKTLPRIEPSSKVVTAVIGVIGIVLIIIFGAPWLTQQFSPTPITETVSMAVPDFTSTFTITPLRLSATPKPSPTLRPTQTPTPLPAWVKDFAEPILAYIADRPPTFEDNFEQPSEDWVLKPHFHDPSPAKQFKYENGKILVTEWPAYRRGFQFNDYVVDVDVQFLPGAMPGSLGLMFRQGDNCHFLVTPGSRVSAWCYKIPGGGERIGNIDRAIDSVGNNMIIRLQLIVKDTRFAFYVDGKPMGYIEHGFLNTGNAWIIAQGGGYGAFDNFKVWDITNLDIP